MASVFTVLRGCLGLPPKIDYSSVKKKDDDFQVSDEATSWVNNHQIDHLIYEPGNHKKTHDFVKKLISDLNKIDINSDNFAMIKNHLVTIVAESNSVKKLILYEIVKFKKDKSFREPLALAIVHIITHKT